MAQVDQRKDQYQILQDNLHQRMDYHHCNRVNCNLRVTSVENQNQISISVTHRVKERHAILDKGHETL